MPLEIRELVIKARIEPEYKGTDPSLNIKNLEKKLVDRVSKHLLQACKQMIEEEFRRRKER